MLFMNTSSLAALSQYPGLEECVWHTLGHKLQKNSPVDEPGNALPTSWSAAFVAVPPHALRAVLARNNAVWSAVARTTEPDTSCVPKSVQSAAQTFLYGLLLTLYAAQEPSASVEDAVDADGVLAECLEYALMQGAALDGAWLTAFAATLCAAGGHERLDLHPLEGYINYVVGALEAPCDYYMPASLDAASPAGSVVQECASRHLPQNP
jgi:hypothetical protein